MTIFYEHSFLILHQLFSLFWNDGKYVNKRTFIIKLLKHIIVYFVIFLDKFFCLSALFCNILSTSYIINNFTSYTILMQMYIFYLNKK